MPSSADIALLDQWQGHIVPRSVDPGFVVLSGFISFIGAWTTLELINRRTAGRGSYNWFERVLLQRRNITDDLLGFYSLDLPSPWAA